MTYQAFLQAVHTHISDSLGPNYHVTIRDIVKNNDTHLDGLTIQSGQCNLSPTIYLNHYFKQYEAGTDLVDICKSILEIYQSSRPTNNIDVSFFTDYEKVKTRIVYKLINYEKNEEMLKDVPHFRLLDLAVVFHCLLESTPDGTATILIHNHHLDLWDVEKEDLYALAAANTPQLLNYDLRSLTDVMRELLHIAGDDPALPPSNELCTMYVLTNSQKLNGAACILYKGLLMRFAERIASDLYVIPSSVHEVLLLSAAEQGDHPKLNEIVREVNTSQLSQEEILSDHIYYFSRETGQLSIPDEES
jgi:hypothetical protein